MREINGYVLIAKANLSEFLFGKFMSPGHGKYENIESNGLTPFKTIEQAEDASRFIFSRTDFHSISLGQLCMKIAETEEELDFVLLDWKGLGTSEQRQKIIEILDKLHLNYKRTSDVGK